MMGDGNLLSLRWNNHISNFKHTLEQLQQKSIFSDAMIACDGQFYPVHKFVLATCSDYFGSIFERMPCKHPVIILKDVAPREIEFLLSYMYGGEVRVSQADLPNLIKAAETLHIRGLAAPDDPPGCPTPGVKHTSKTIFQENNEVPTKRPRLDYIPAFENEIGNIKAELDEENSLNNEQEDPSQKQDCGYILSKFSDSTIPKLNAETFYVAKEKFSTEFHVKEECEELLSQLEDSDCHDKSQIHQAVTVLDKTLATRSSERNNSVSDEAMMSSSSLFEQSIDPSFQSQALGTEKVDCIPKIGITYQNIQASMSVMQPLNQIIFNCHLCDYTTYNKSWLNIHMRKHTGEKPYSCPFCSFRSAQKGNLNVHVKKIHSSLPILPLPMTFEWTLQSTNSDET